MPPLVKPGAQVLLVEEHQVDAVEVEPLTGFLPGERSVPSIYAVLRCHGQYLVVELDVLLQVPAPFST